MANDKLTNDILKDLIREVLSESTNTITVPTKKGKTTQISISDIKSKSAEFDQKDYSTVNDYILTVIENSKKGIATLKQDPVKHNQITQSDYDKVAMALGFTVKTPSPKPSPKKKTTTKAPKTPPKKKTTTKAPASKVDFKAMKHGLKTKDASPNKFDFAIAKIPTSIKNIILRLFGPVMDTQEPGLSDTDKLTKIARIAESSVIKENTSNIDWKDFASILKNPDSDYHKAALLTVRQAQNIASLDPTLKDAAKTLTSVVNSLNLKAPDDPDVSSKEVEPEIPVVGISDIFAGGKEGRKEVPSYVVKFFNNLNISGASTVKSRIEAINNATEKIISGSFTKDDNTLGELMSILGVTGLMARIAKTMDNKAAGWAFESFLAQLVNGTTEGAAMGAADFTYGIPDDSNVAIGAKGSAKLVSSYSFTQSWNTFSMSMPNEPKPTATNMNNRLNDYAYTGAGGAVRTPKSEDITWGNNELVYLVGVKLDDSNATTAATGDIAKVAIHMIKVTRTQGTGRTTLPADFSVSGGSSITDSQGKPKVTFNSNSKLGVISFHKDFKKLNELSTQAMDKINDKVPLLMKSMESFRRSTNSYLSSGVISDVNKATESYVELFDLINEVFAHDSVTGMSGVKAGVAVDSAANKIKQTSATALQENKSLKKLDKLIERVILEHINK